MSQTILSLEEVKEYLRLDYAEDDALLLEIIEAAQEWAEEYCGHSLAEHPDISGSAKPPKKFKIALRQIVAHWYENREMVSSGGTIPREVPFMARMVFDQTRRVPL